MDLIEVSSNQNRHPWELSRTRSILRILKQLQIKGRILDIGCGDSFFDRNLAERFPDAEVYGVDIYLKAEWHEDRVHAVNSLDHLPPCKFDYILMMDVLEHIKDDKGYLNDIKKRLKPNGKIIITVPAFMKLYSLHDRELRHYRRYEHSRLLHVIKKSGLKEERWSYFYFSLILARLLTMNKTENLSGWNYPANHIRTKLVTTVLNLDFDILLLLSRIGIHLPGLSLLSVCRLKGAGI